MPEFNIERIKTIIGEINTALSKLEKTKSLNQKEFLDSQEKIDSAKYNLIVAIEGAIDICYHVTAKAGGRAPANYSDCFTILHELDLFPDGLGEKLKQMAKFRNLLVHRYRQVDNQRVFDIIKEEIPVIREYLKSIEVYVTRE